MKVALVTTDNREHYGDYASPFPYFGTAPTALLKGFEDTNGLEVHVVSCLRQKVQSPRQIGRNIFYHSVTVPKFGWLRTFYLGCIGAVRAKLREIKPDIVHGQGTERDCALAAVFSGFPNVLTIHGNMVEIATVMRAGTLSYHWFAARLESLALRRTFGVFCNSKHTERLVGPRAKRTWPVPNALQLPFFEKPPAPRQAALPTLLHVGAIYSNKHQLEALDMAEDLYHKGAKFRLDFMGQANTAEYAQVFLEKVKLAEKQGFARYLGMQNLQELMGNYDRSHGLVHTPDSEAFGLVVAEALARNMKVFAFDTGGVADILTGVDGAVSCPSGNWGCLSQAIGDWLMSGSPAPAASSELMRERYHPQQIARRHVEIYQEVLRNRNASARADSGPT